MIDPYVRVTLLPSLLGTSAHTPSTLPSTRYSATFKLPDQHGVFTLLLAYKRATAPFYTFLEVKETVAVTPPRHDEWPRFIASAWPYYLSAAGTSAAFLAFVALWLSLAPGAGTAKGSAKRE
jgi:oligosaccharyltransferase complex subunit beta